MLKEDNMDELKELQAIINTLQELEIRPTPANVNYLLGIYQAIQRLIDAAKERKKAETGAEVTADG